MILLSTGEVGALVATNKCAGSTFEQLEAGPEGGGQDARNNGLWLEQAGFDIKTPARVRVMPGCLVVTAEEQN